MKIKGIDVSDHIYFKKDMRLAARLWKGILIKEGEVKVKKHFKEVFKDSAFKKFPETLTPNNIETTFLSFTRDDFKCK